MEDYVVEMEANEIQKTFKMSAEAVKDLMERLEKTKPTQKKLREDLRKRLAVWMCTFIGSYWLCMGDTDDDMGDTDDDKEYDNIMERFFTLRQKLREGS